MSCFIVCVVAERPSQQCFSHVGTEPPLSGYYQSFSGSKCVFAQGHNTAEVGIEPPTSRSGVRDSTTRPPRSPANMSMGDKICWVFEKSYWSFAESVVKFPSTGSRLTQIDLLWITFF